MAGAEAANIGPPAACPEQTVTVVVEAPVSWENR